MKKIESEKKLTALIKRIAESPSNLPRISMGIGDDSAIFRPKKGQELLLTVDSMIEDVHFKREWMSSYEIGWRLAAVNLSDIAAMGGKPLCALLSLAIPDYFGTRRVKELIKGLVDHLATYSAALAGGNISGIQKNLVADLTLLGSCERGGAWRRSCRPGNDAIVVVGELGSARAGLEILMGAKREKRFSRLVGAFIKPQPLVKISELLKGNSAIHGAIDVSDGFSMDLIRVCEASGCGCDVDASRLPITKELAVFCEERGKDPFEYALQGGEDYSLILSVSRNKAESIVKKITGATGLRASVVGKFLKRKGWYRVRTTGGKRIAFRANGWDHLSGFLS